MPHVAPYSGEGQVGQARAVELDELSHDPLLAEHLRDRQHEIRRRRPLGEPARELHPHDLRDEHADGLAEHRRLGLDTADAPAEDAEPVDHRGVRVGADERVGVGLELAVGEDDAREVLDVHLVDDPGVRRDDLEVLERLLPPLEEAVTLPVARELELGVPLERDPCPEVVDLDGVIDDELDRLERVDLLRIAPQRLHRLTHRGQIHHRRHPGEVLQEHAARRERDLARGLGGRVPGGEAGDVRGPNGTSVLGAQQVLEQDAERERQARDVCARDLRVDRVEAVDGVGRVLDSKR